VLLIGWDNMTNLITLQNTSLSTSTAVRLLNAEFTYGWKNLINANPSNTVFGTTETVMNGWENPRMTIRFYIPIDNTPAGSMTWALWNEFAKAEYLGSTNTRTSLILKAGAADTSFASYARDDTTTAITAIPVSIMDFTLRISPDDSLNSYMWIIDAHLMETK
jgi:hypothetical protein